MEYYIDTANIEKIRECVEYFPVSGVTTNPTLVSKEKDPDFAGHLKAIREIIGKERMMHVQVTSMETDEMVKEALALNEYIGGDKGLFAVKVPVSRAGLRATAILHSMGITVTETAIFTQQQALVAARAGADFVAPYVNRLDNIVSDGVSVVTEIVELFRMHNIKTKVLAASFKTVEQIHKIAMAGTDCATVDPDLLGKLVYHPMTLYAIDDFAADWEGLYGKGGILDKLPGGEDK